MRGYGALLVGIGSVIALVIAPLQAAEAFSFSHRHPSWNRSQVVIVLPWGARRLGFGDGSYYYCEGRYYKHIPHGYVVVPAPVGAVVPSLPASQRTLVIDGVTYIEYGGVYYRSGPAGYTVVPIAQAPEAGATSIAVDSSQVPAAAPMPAAAAPATTVVNVPNKNGSFTPVTLQLAGSGMYIGPQGEIYPNLPTAQQLQSMYGK